MNGKAKTVVVLMGGTSCERDVSLVSGAAVAEALGATFALPGAATPDADVVFHASASSDEPP